MKKQIWRNHLSPYNISTLQLEKQIMSSKEQTEKENKVGTTIEEQDETSEKARNRQAMSGKEKQMGKQYI